MFLKAIKNFANWTEKLSNQAHDYRINQTKVIAKERFDRIVFTIKKNHPLDYVSLKELKTKIPSEIEYQNHLFYFIKNILVKKLNIWKKDTEQKSIILSYILSNMREKYPNRDLDDEIYENIEEMCRKYRNFSKVLCGNIKKSVTVDQLGECEHLSILFMDFFLELIDSLLEIYPELREYDYLLNKNI